MAASASRNGSYPELDPEMEDSLLPETDLDEESLALLEELVGKRVVSLTLWADPLAEAVAEELGEVERHLVEDVLVDVDLYFEENLLLELYNTMVYLDETRPPLEDKGTIARTLRRFVEQGIRLEEVAEEEESGAPIFVFRHLKSDETLLLVADGWIVDTWDALPEEE